MYNVMHLPGVIEIGVTGENQFRRLEFDMRPWLEVLPGGVGSIVHIRPGETGDDAYVAATTMEDGILTWELTAGDVGEVEGYGQMEIWLEDPNTARGKSTKCQTYVRSSLALTHEIPEAQEAWLEQMTGLKTETVIAAQSAEDAREAAESAQTAAEAARDAAQAVAGDFQGLSATASGLAAGTSPTVNVTHDEGGLFNLAFGIPKGDKGDQGDPPTDSQVQTAANNYLSQVITNPDSPPLDRALSSNAAAAPADMVGDLKSAITQISTAISQSESKLLDYITVTGASVTPITDGYKFEGSSAWAGMFFPLSVIPDADYTVLFDYTQGTGNMFVSITNEGRTVQIVTKTMSSSGKNLIAFNSGNYTKVLIGFQNVSANGVSSIANIKVIAENQLNVIRDQIAGSVSANIIQPYIADFEDGMYYAYNTGSRGQNASYSASPLIPAPEKADYSFSGTTGFHICFLNYAKEYISGTLSGTFTTPDGCVYMRISIASVDKANVSLKKTVIEKAEITFEDIDNISNGGYTEFGLLPSGTTYNWSSNTALISDTPISGVYKVVGASLNVNTAGSFKIGLYWLNDGDATISHLVEVSTTSTGVVTFDLNFATDTEKTYYMFAIPVSGSYKYASNNIQNKYYSFSGLGIAVGSVVALTQANNGLSVYQGKCIKTVTETGKGVIVVAKNGGDYSTIQEAVNVATNGETILVYPGIYDEVVIVPNSGGRNIIGIDREKCVIRSQSGKYADAPLKIYGNFYLENMTLIATADEAGAWYPTWDSSDNTTFASYAIHVDGWTSDWNGAKGIIRNCTLYSECNHAAGCGVQKGYTLEFENCEIVRNVTDTRYLNSNYDGAMGVHSPNVNETGTTGEHLIMRDCTVINKRHLKALQLFHVFSGATMDAEIKGCTFKDSVGIDNVIKFWNCTNAIITDMSHGNSTDECNYRIIHQ